MSEAARYEGRSPLPTDAFSLEFRALTDNPGAVRVSSTVNLIDVYGRTESWIVDTFRVDGRQTVFVQRMSAEGALRLVLPPEVTTKLIAQHDRATTQNRKRGARAGIATRIARGDTLGNPSALQKARTARRKTKRHGASKS